LVQFVNQPRVSSDTGGKHEDIAARNPCAGGDGRGAGLCCRHRSADREGSIAVVPTWTGFYAGINGGVAGMWGPSMSYDDPAINAYAPLTVTGSSSTKAIGGFHAGYLKQYNSWVVGIEADFDWTKLKDGATSGLLCSGPPFRGQCGGVAVLTDNAFLQTGVNWLASLRGRLGFVWNQWLLYGTAGVAFAGVDYTANVNCSGIAPTFCTGGAQAIRSTGTGTRIGGVIGGGAEFKPAQNWVFGLEYLYYGFGDEGTMGGSWFTVATGAPAPFFECTVPGQNCALFTYRSFGIHTGRLRLSYQFQP
jgi:outer membrane immunogenic protein